VAAKFVITKAKTRIVGTSLSHVV